MTDFHFSVNSKLKICRSILLIGAVGALLGLLISLVTGGTLSMAGVCCFMVLASAGAYCYLEKTRRIGIVALGMWLAYVLVWFPTLVLYDGGIQGPSAIVFVLSIIIAFSLFDRPLAWRLAGVSILVFCTMLCVLFSLQYRGFSLNEPMTLLLHVMLCFCMALLVMVRIASCMKEELEEQIFGIEKNEKLHLEIIKNQDAFVRNLGKCYRSMLTSVTNMLEVMGRDPMSYETQTQFQILKGNAEALLEFVDDLLSYSSLVNGNNHLNEGEFCLGDMYREIMNQLKRENMDRDITYEAGLQASIPSVLYGDTVRIRQVISTLLFRASNGMDSGKICFYAEGEYGETEEDFNLRIRIMDSGKGLGEEDVRFISDGNVRNNERIGALTYAVGLKYLICERLVEMMNGVFQIKSLKGLGVVIEISLPCKVVEASHLVSLKEKNPSILVYLGNKRQDKEHWENIMQELRIVPDYAVNYFSLQRYLASGNYDVVFALAEDYKSIANLLAACHCEERTYIVGNDEYVLGDFGSCRICHNPLTVLEVGEILNGEWKRENFIKTANNSSILLLDTSVLVVDDNSVNLMVASGIMKKYGCKITLAHSGQEALEKMQQTRFDLVFLDMLMPEMCGDEVVKLIRARKESYYRELPIIALTASITGNIREEVLEKGFQEYLSKPIKIRYLERCFHDFLPEEKIVRISEEKAEDSRKQLPKEELEGLWAALSELDLKNAEEILRKLRKKDCSNKEKRALGEIHLKFSTFDYEKAAWETKKMIEG